MTQIRTIGPKTGTCNICGIGPQKLTDDHTPPKGCVRPTQMLLRHVTQVLTVPPEELHQQRFVKALNGVVYRTLCSHCNNTMLGTRYDPALVQFCADIVQAMKAPPLTPLEIRCFPQKVMRAALGHLWAVGLERSSVGNNTQALRDYFFNPDAPLPKGIKMFYWAYPHRRQALLRDIGMADVLRGGHMTFWLMKFFPIAILIALHDDLDVPMPLSIHPFEPWRNVPAHEEAVLPLRTYPLVSRYWPEYPGEGRLLLVGEENLIADNHSRH